MLGVWLSRSQTPLFLIVLDMFFLLSGSCSSCCLRAVQPVVRSREAGRLAVGESGRPDAFEGGRQSGRLDAFKKAGSLLNGSLAV